MVAHPRDYPWSSYAAHACGAADDLVKDHPLYRALGRGAAERHAAYCALFRTPLEAAFLDGLRAATNGGWAMGSERFKRKIAKALGRRVAPLPPGRPPAEAKNTN
jgi:putative transposase